MCAEVEAGHMAYIGDVRDDLPLIIGRRGMGVREWSELNKGLILKLS
jgi:hypothetical protein